ncbi:MAG TPA: hypothetical protein VMF89_21485, partial [Polyangiales bacterium]|nr:hypothetical protein [Polyangiales bacterium]
PPPRRGVSTGQHRIQREGGVSIQADPSALEHFVRINPAGEVVAAQGSAQRLASLSTYICSLADTVGELLDIGPCQVMEAAYTGGRLITVREPDGSIVGLKPRVPQAPQGAQTQPVARVGSGR